MSEYLEALVDSYSKNVNEQIEVPFEDMNLILEEDNISLLFVFNNIESYFDRKGNKTDYYVDLHGVYVEFK